MIVDLFAGGGGASVGIEAATGRIVDVAINHSPVAMAVHKANHPKTRHMQTSVWDVKPKAAVGKKPVELLWASPDCTHFSVAKGGKPREHGTRSLAWVVVEWARAVRPAVICLENVREFLGWGPLDPLGKPIKARMGETFAQWRGALEILGYKVDHRILDASLYGAPTRRRRLFLVARCDGLPICWPEPTHGPGRKPLRTAAECIDWSISCPSIFERKKPLAEKTLWRIAQGIRRFVLESPNPFIVEVNHGKRDPRVAPIDQPLGTTTATQRSRALVTPVMATIDNRSTKETASSPTQPIPTTTTKARHVVIAPTLVQTGYGERPAVGDSPGQRPRYLDIHAPMGTLMAEGVVIVLIDCVTGIPTTPPKCFARKAVTSPCFTQDHHAVVDAKLAAVCLTKFRGTDGQNPAGSAKDPLPTISAGGIHAAEVRAWLGPPPPGGSDFSAEAAEQQREAREQWEEFDPKKPADPHDHTPEVRAFLTAYYGDDHAQGMGQDVREPARTLTTKARLGLVTVSGVDYQIVDIGMRMLEPHELLAAQFGRFAEGYDLSAATTKAAKVRLIGNSVCPEVAEAVVAANVPKLKKARRAA